METKELMPDVISCGWYSVRFDYHASRNAPCIDLNKLADVLPHGSGIDSDWHVTVRKNGDVVAMSSYHQMDESGGYNGWRDFKVVIGTARKQEYKALMGPCAGQWQVTRKIGTVYLMSFTGGGRNNSDYLYDVVSCALADGMGIKAITSDVVGSEAAAKELR